MRRDNAAGGKMTGMFRRELAAVGERMTMASASRRNSEGVRREITESQRESVGCVQVELVGVNERIRQSRKGPREMTGASEESEQSGAEMVAAPAEALASRRR
jgi:hypothetical protein